MKSPRFDKLDHPRGHPLFVCLKDHVASVGSWWVICVIWIGLVCWRDRHAMHPDALSYIDLASEAVSGGPGKLVNGYWSPLYPGLIGIAFLIFRPTAGREFAIAHLVNFVVFLGVLWSYTFFVRSWIRTRADDKADHETIRRYIIPFSFCFFLWFTLTFIGIGNVTPDLSVEGMIFLAAGICCRASLPNSTWRDYAGLGVALALGYYTKTVFFPLGLLLLAILFFCPPYRFMLLRILL